MIERQDLFLTKEGTITSDVYDWNTLRGSSVKICYPYIYMYKFNSITIFNAKEQTFIERIYLNEEEFLCGIITNNDPQQNDQTLAYLFNKYNGLISQKKIGKHGIDCIITSNERRMYPNIKDKYIVDRNSVYLCEYNMEYTTPTKNVYVMFVKDSYVFMYRQYACESDRLVDIFVKNILSDRKKNEFTGSGFDCNYRSKKYKCLLSGIKSYGYHLIGDYIYLTYIDVHCSRNLLVFDKNMCCCYFNKICNDIDIYKFLHHNCFFSYDQKHPQLSKLLHNNMNITIHLDFNIWETAIFYGYDKGVYEMLYINKEQYEIKKDMIVAIGNNNIIFLEESNYKIKDYGKILRFTKESLVNNVITLLLCHTYNNGLFGKLPQEMINIIVVEYIKCLITDCD